MEGNFIDNEILNTREEEIYKSLSNSLNLDENTRNTALEIIKEFKLKTKVLLILNQANDIIPELLLSCSFFVASRTQVMVSVTGEKIKGIGLSLSQIIRATRSLQKEKFSLYKFFQTLKTYITHINLEEELKMDLKGIIDNFAFSFTIFGKYEDLFKKLHIIPKNNNPESFFHIERLKNMGWLIFFQTKSSNNLIPGKILKDQPKNIVSNAALLINVLFEICRNLNSSFQVYFFEEIKSKKRDFDLKNEAHIREVLCEMIKLSDKELFNDYNTKLLAEFERQRDSSHSNLDFFHPENIQYYHNRLENLISHDIQAADEFDERCFLEEETVYTPAKLTPFEKQRTIPSRYSHNPSNKLLSFNMNDNAGISIKTSLQDFRIEKRVSNSPYTPRSILTSKRVVPETPMTSAMEMYNWLQEYKHQGKIKENLLTRINFLSQEPTLREQILDNAERLITKLQTSYRVTDSNQMLSFYCLVLERMINIEGKKTNETYIQEILLNENFHKSLLAICIETITFIMNYSNLQLTKLIENCEIEAFDFWKNITSFIKFDSRMPIPVKEHFLILERKIVFELAWVSGSHIDGIVDKFDLHDKESITHIKKDQLMYQEEAFFKRLLCHAAFQLNKICEELNLHEGVSEHIWIIIKHILSHEPDLIIDRHIDQLIICTVYCVGKLTKSTMKFKDIIDKYKDLVKEYAIFDPLVTQVTMDGSNIKADIINFYNSIFLTRLKSFLNSLRTGNSSNVNKQNALLTLPIMSTPLRESIRIYSPYKNRMTPNTIKLCAIGEFTQSPAKQYSQFMQGASTPTSNRKLQFDDQKTSKSNSLFNKLKRIDSSNAEKIPGLEKNSSIKTFLDNEKEAKKDSSSDSKSMEESNNK